MNEKLKVFRVWADDWSDDRYDSFIILDKDKESVSKLFETDINGDRIYLGFINDPRLGFYKFPYKFKFKSDQGELHIEEINITTPALISASYNAG